MKPALITQWACLHAVPERLSAPARFKFYVKLIHISKSCATKQKGFIGKHCK